MFAHKNTNYIQRNTNKSLDSSKCQMEWPHQMRFEISHCVSISDTFFFLRPYYLMSACVLWRYVCFGSLPKWTLGRVCPLFFLFLLGLIPFFFYYIRNIVGQSASVLFFCDSCWTNFSFDFSLFSVSFLSVSPSCLFFHKYFRFHFL